jgi:hypothetical protein
MAKEPTNLGGLVKRQQASVTEKPKQRAPKATPAPEPEKQDLGPPRRLGVTLSAEDYVRLRILAARTGRKHQDLLSEAVLSYLDAREMKA